MTHDRQPQYSTLKQAFDAVGQGHVFAFWNTLGSSQRAELLDDLASINIAQLPEASALAASGGSTNTPQKLEPAPVQRMDALSPDIAIRGDELLRSGRIAAFTVAGGQGTRLGFDGPKGAFPISPVKNKPLFQLFAESIRATDHRYGCRTPWYIMTSPANDAETQSYFSKNNYFGLSPDRTLFFQQGVMPAFDRHGKILLDQPHRVALSPDGHGGSLLALARSGMLADMAQRGVQHLSYFQIDNPLVRCLDPLFLGLHDAGHSEMSSKTLPKADDMERVGNFCFADGHLTVIEYSDLPESVARLKNPDGSRRFDAANIAVHVLSRAFVERLTANQATFALPWHRAIKKVPFVDLQTHRRVEPAEPNAVKLEAFIFDALPLAKNPILLETSRAEEFSPVKNATGVDSVDTSRRDQSLRAARWLKSAGVSIPEKPGGEPNGLFEISPLYAMSAAELREKKPQTAPVAPGAQVYLE